MFVLLTKFFPFTIVVTCYGRRGDKKKKNQGYFGGPLVQKVKREGTNRTLFQVYEGTGRRFMYPKYNPWIKTLLYPPTSPSLSSFFPKVNV